MTAAAIVVTATGGVITAPPAVAQQVVLSVGHVDAVDVHFEDGDLVMKVRDDTGEPPPEIRDPADVTFQVLPSSEVQVPDIPEFGFLGPPGTTLWVLPQIQDPNLLWPGYNTTELLGGIFTNDRVRLSLVSVDGPGSIVTFTVDPFGHPTMQWNSGDGTPDAIDVPVSTHAHTNWAFSALGTYTLNFQADATLVGGGEVSTGPVPYRFVVGDLEPALTLAIEGLQPSYGVGDTVTLTAVPSRPTELDSYRWLHRCPGAEDWSVIPGETAATYTFTAVAAVNGCQYQARLLDEQDQEVAASEAVTLVVNQEPAPDLSQVIVATIDESQGALVVSIDPNDRTVVMPVLRLGRDGDRWESTGELRPVTVTDTRSARPGWNVSGQVGDFTAGDLSFDGKYLGWAPAVLSQADNQQVAPGQPVPTGFLSGDGLSISAVLGSAPAGGGIGTARLGAGLTLEVPTQTSAGAYSALLTVTAI